jgi:hypothetical protein
MSWRIIMLRSSRSVLVTLLAAACPAAAQSLSIPKDLQAIEANSDHATPSRYAPSRSQTKYADAVLPWPGRPMTINGVALRRDGGDPRSFVLHGYDLELGMSSTGVKPPEASDTSSYKANHGTDFSVAFQRKVLVFPAEPAPSPAPAAFRVRLPFDAPFVLADRHLLVEVTAFGTRNQDQLWLADAQEVTGAGNPVGRHRNFGTGCPAVFVGGASATYPGSVVPLVIWSDTFAPRTQTYAGIVFIGNRTTHFAPGVPLPIDLTSAGAPGCNLLSNWILGLAAATDTTSVTSRMSIDIGRIPPDPALGGIKVFVQHMLRDATFNALGTRWSDGTEIEIGAGFRPGTPYVSMSGWSTGPTKFDPMDDTPLFVEIKAPVFEVY